MSLCPDCVKQVESEMERLFLVQTLEIKRLERELRQAHEVNRSLERQRAGIQALFEEVGRKRIDESFGSAGLSLF